MLVLTRIEGQDIIIIPEDENGKKLEPICIKVVTADRGRVKIGVTAPKKYSVNRKEIQEKIENKKQIAEMDRLS